MRSSVFIWMMVTVLLLGACSSNKSRFAEQEKSDPAAVNTQLAIEYMREGMNEAAMEKFKKALKQNPHLQVAHSSVAILYERLGETALAEKHYRKAYNLNRKDSPTLNNYGQFLCREGRLKEADEMFTRAVKNPLYSYPETVYTNAGICALRQPDPVLADTYFRKALQANPKYPPALREMAKSSFVKEKYLATRAYLQRLQEVSGLTPEYLWIGVQAESVLGDRDAVSSYALALKNRFPESDETQALFEWERKQGGH
ncbi:MAG: type IV pilus biogenesis/stability protein PilW [Gammaproteobacteria bacterium]|nr:MAG: type IV pilus biogenesis/stability protein PilW [Gammaproteobacteria bacterium]